MSLQSRQIATTFLLLSIAILGAAGPVDASRRLPVDGGTITSGIGWRPDPFGSGRLVYHHGVDIAVPEGTPVYPTERGTVLHAGPYKGYGNLVAVNHGNGYVTLYGHNASVQVTAGQAVDSRTVIALSGNTGRSTGPHVHYEVRQMSGADRQAQARRAAELKELVDEQVEGWIDTYEAGGRGAGGSAPAPAVDPLAELALPTDEGF